MAKAQRFKVSASGQLSLPAAVRRRWHLESGGAVDVVDLGFGVLTVPAGAPKRLLDSVLAADEHYRNVKRDSDPDLKTS